MGSRCHRAISVFGCALALWLISAGSSLADREPSVSLAQVGQEGTPTGSDEEKREPAEPEQGAPQSPEQAPSEELPENVEVLRVRSRGGGAIQTEIPSSVSQFDAATVQALGAQDISDLARVTPNVNIVQPGATQATFYVRGIGLSDFQANAAGAVTIFQDDVALNAPAIQTGQLFDISNVEIVRGPQGTGHFRNASGGAIRVQSNLPSGNYGASMRSSIGRYAADGGQGAHHALIQDYEGHLEMPVTDALSSRFAFRLREADPYQTNGCGNAIPFDQRLPRQGNSPVILAARDICGERGFTIWPRDRVSQVPPGLPSKVDRDDTWAARGFLRFNPPGSDLDLVLNAHGSRLDEDQTYGQAIGNSIAPGRGFFFGGTTGQGGLFGYQEPDQSAEVEDRCRSFAFCPREVLLEFEKVLAEKRPLDRRPYRGDYNREGVTTRDTWGTYLSGKYVLGDLDLFVLGSFDGYERFRDQDTDFTPDVLFEAEEFDEAWQTYEELSIGGELADEPLEWEVGGYYLQEALDSDGTTIVGSSGGFSSQIVRTYSQDTNSFGTWGKFTWDFLDDVTLGGGVRWNWEKKDFAIRRGGFVIIDGVSFGGETISANQDEIWQTPTGNLILTYHFGRETSAFAKYTRGFKAGHFNALTGADLDRPPAKPEYNDAWEAGLAGSWFGRRVSGSLAYFYYRYQDYQIFLFRDVANEPPVLEIINANQAENYGIEVEGRLQPLRGWAPRAVEGLLLSANFGWLHGEFLDFQLRNTLPLGLEVLPITIDFSGDQLPNSPEYKVSATAEWTFDLGRWGSVIPRYDFIWTDDVSFGLNEGRGTAIVDLQGNPRLPEFAVGQKAYWLHNIRLAYRTPTGNVEVAGWVRNIDDVVYRTYAFDATNFSNLVLNFVGTPRTIGVDVIVTF